MPCVVLSALSRLFHFKMSYSPIRYDSRQEKLAMPQYSSKTVTALHNRDLFLSVISSAERSFSINNTEMSSFSIGSFLLMDQKQYAVAYFSHGAGN